MALTEFGSFLVSCKSENISLNGVDVENIIKSYFGMEYPFEEAKKDEFPDAISICSILKEIRRLSNGQQWFPDYEGTKVVSEDLFYCVVSADKGFRTTLEEKTKRRINEDIILFESLDELINFFVIQDEKAYELQRKLKSGKYERSIIMTTVNEGLSRTSYNVEDPGGYVEDVSFVEMDTYNHNIFVVDYQEMNEGKTFARIYVKVNFCVTLEYVFINVMESYWDKEEQDYLWKEIIDITAKFETVADICFRVWIYEGGEIEFIDYDELPVYVEVDREDLIEIISYEEREL